MVEVSCIFTREIEPETYKQVSEDKIRDRFREIVENYIEACPRATLVSIDDVYLDSDGESVTPQPFLEAVVNCESNPENCLVENDVSMIGDASYFDEELFPVQLLGSSYWVDESISPSEDVKSENEEDDPQSVADKIVDWIFSAI